MHIWTLERWKRHMDSSRVSPRSRVRIVFDKGINEELKQACRDFVVWVKAEYYFPVPLCVRIKKQRILGTQDSDEAVGTFWEPVDHTTLPHIRVAVGDYSEILKELGRDDAIATILTVIAHEMTHYFQWINAIPLTERGRERQAVQYSHFVIDEYALTREHP